MEMEQEQECRFRWVWKEQSPAETFSPQQILVAFYLTVQTRQVASSDSFLKVSLGILQEGYVSFQHIPCMRSRHPYQQIASWGASESEYHLPTKLSP